MGQQQLLLLVLVVIIVGAALVPVSTIFLSTAMQNNRDAIINDMLNLSAKSQRYYRTPAQIGGGSDSYDGFALSPSDTGNANGSFSLSTTEPTGVAFVPGSTTALSGSNGVFYVVGCGKELGDNRSTPVKCYIKITKSTTNVTILN